MRHSAAESRRRLFRGVTNELLKIIPAFREQEGRILICATNFIRALDTAFLRHGRFDYVIPIGLPDPAARGAIWTKYIPEATGHVDVPALARQTERFSPADIEFAARKASQRALECPVSDAANGANNPVEGSLTTDSYLQAVSQTKATVTEAMVSEFREDIARLART